MAWRRGDEKASLCTVVKIRRPAALGVPPLKQMKHGESPSPGPPPWLPGLGATGAKGCGSEEQLGALRLQAPDPHPIPGCAETLLLWPGPLWEELLCLSTSEGDGNGCVSRRLSGEGEVGDRHAPPGNAPRYLRRHRATRIMTRSVQTGSMAQAGDRGRVREA